MNPLIQSWLATLLRHALSGLGVWLVAHAGMSEGDAASCTEGTTLIIISVGWSLWQKYRSQLKLVTALAVAPTSELHLETMITRGLAGPSVFTPRDVRPTV